MSPLKQFLEDAFAASVRLSPETLTRMGIPERQGELDDRSPEAAETLHRLQHEQLAGLRRFDIADLDASDRMNYRLFERELSEAIARYPYRHHNYLINQKFGLHNDFPAFMINLHRVQTLEDAQNYIARLETFGATARQVIEGLSYREEQGIVPPQYLFPQIIGDCSAFIGNASRVENNALYQDFSTKLKGLGECSESQHSDLLRQARIALQESVLPGYRELVAFLQDQQQRAPAQGGAWALPDGDDYYAACLAQETSTALTAEEIYQYGKEEVARIQQEMLRLCPALGVQGDLQALFEHARQAPQFYFAQTAQGREACLAALDELISAMHPRLPALFVNLPKDELEVRAVEAHREKTAGLAFYQGPSADGKRPGVFYANLHDLQQLPTFVLAALAYHEAVPGHHMQFSIANRLTDLPSFRRYSSHNAYIEGWALYAERICHEIGLYDDSWANFGRLDQELKRACRLVADTGVHARRWTREQTIRYLFENTPATWAQAEMEADRYVVMPGQATTYKVGMRAILTLRTSVRSLLGESFDLRLFHDELLRHGPLPLDLLAELVDSWAADAEAAT